MPDAAQGRARDVFILRSNRFWILAILLLTTSAPTALSQPPPDPVADLVLSVDARVEDGSMFVVSMEAFNQGEKPATDVFLNGTLTDVPGGWTITGPDGCVMDGEELTCDWRHVNGTDPSGAQSFFLTLTAAFDCGGLVGNFSVSASNDANPANNAAPVTIEDSCDRIADLEFELQWWSDPTHYGVNGTVRNLGPNPAQNTSLDFALPSSPEAAAWTLVDPTHQCILESYFDGVFVFCRFGTLQVGHERTVTIQAPACSRNEVTVFAAVGSDWDLVSQNNHADVTFEPGCDAVAPTTEVPVFPNPVAFGLGLFGALGGVYVILRQRRP